MSNINLLPGEIKEELIQTKRNKSTREYLLGSLFILFFITTFSVFTFMLLREDVKKTSRTLGLAQSEVDSFGNLEAEATILAERIKTIGLIKNEINIWSVVLSELDKTLPAEIRVSLISIDEGTENRGRISGFSDSKSSVAAIRNSIEKSNKFEHVNIESSNSIINPENQSTEENFIITFSLTKDALKGEQDE